MDLLSTLNPILDPRVFNRVGLDGDFLKTAFFRPISVGKIFVQIKYYNSSRS